MRQNGQGKQTDSCGSGTRSPLTRRAFLGSLTATVTGALLAACGTSAASDTHTTVTDPTADTAGAAQIERVGTNPGTGTAGTTGAVFALTNEEAGNNVAVFTRAADGKLTFTGLVSTGGKGIGEQEDGEGLGSQSALLLSRDNRFLFAANGGSGTISVFTLAGVRPTLVQQIPSNGPRPISMTIRDNILYVLNYSRQAPGKGNITAFTLGGDDRLAPLVNSTRPLSSDGNVDPGQVRFSPRGDLLVVTEKATNKIVTYTVGSNGLAGNPTAFPAAGEAPFSLAFTGDYEIITADNYGDAERKGAASAYTLTTQGKATPLTKSLADKQTGACWVAVTGDHKGAYVVNTGANVISGYRIAPGGKISLLNADGVTAKGGGKPRDLALSSDSRYLYLLNSTAGTVGTYAIQADGGLKALGDVGKFPAPGANGLAAW